ncbi:MAG: hypothetical protein IK066_12245 [Kiritimatiellae bacterium]|nr:hypothetical protein [Kiritimatiellia bacterium]
MSRQLGACAAGLAFCATAAFGGMQWGGYVHEGWEHQFRANAGGIFEFEGMVEETTRKYYDAVGRQSSQGDAERYGTDDFDADGFHGMLGLSWNRNWQGFRLQLDTSFLNPEIDSTASRDYWLTVQGDVDYRGRSYDHMLIPAGSPFSMELLGNMTELTLSLVPFGFQSENGWLTVTPSLDAGLLALVGQYTIDAGDARGVREYQNPPEQFVVGGHSDGFGGAAMPQVGVGVNIVAGEADGVQLELDAHYLMMTYNGSTGFFTTAEHRKKDLDLDHRNIRVRGAMSFPMGKTRLIAGLQVELIDLEGTLESTGSSREEIIARRERFDKEFAFTMHSVMATLGFVF